MTFSFYYKFLFRSFYLEIKIYFTVLIYRYMKTLKGYVRNTSRPEGCIAKSYVAEECIRFCGGFLKSSVVEEDGKIVRNEDFGDEVILEGRPISAATPITLSDREKKLAHLAVIMNTAMVDPYLE